MNQKYSVLCLFALSIVAVLAFKNYETWTSPFDASPEKAFSKKTGAKPDSGSPGNPKDPN